MLAGLPPAQRDPVMAVSLRDPERFIEHMMLWHAPAVEPEHEGLWESERRLLRFAACAYEAATLPSWAPRAPNDVQAAVRDRAADVMADVIRTRDPGKTLPKLHGRLNQNPRGWVPGGGVDREDDGGSKTAAPPRPARQGYDDRETVMNEADMADAGLSGWTKREWRQARRDDFTSTDIAEPAVPGPRRSRISPPGSRSRRHSKGEC
jgi:hypothetical protein